HISALQRKGFLKRIRHKARSLRLSESIKFPDERPTMLPLVGTIAAGKPIEAFEDREVLDLEEVFTGRGEGFVLRVLCDSMIDEHIRDGDVVVCEQGQSARDGEMVVALVGDGEATLKRVYRDREGIRLQPSNSAYKPIVRKDVSIQGVVVGVLRRY